MSYVSEVLHTAPAVFTTDLQKRVYETFEKLHIPFLRVDTTEAITMEDCRQIDERLQMKTVKTLFLCNRQQTDFYLFVTKGDKPFVTKDFGQALHIARVSFAPASLLLSKMGTTVGATTVLSTLLDPDHSVKVVFDREVLTEPWYGCSDGTTTSYLRLKMEDLTETFLGYTGHRPLLIDV